MFHTGHGEEKIGEEIKASSMLPPLPHSYFVSLPDISWSCLISEHASGNVSPCGLLCHRWSITTGVGLLLAEAHGSPWSSQISGKCQLSALIGSVMYSGPFASFMPPKPKKSGVGRYAWCACVWPALSALSCQNLDPKLTFLHDLEATFLLDQSFSSFAVRAHGQGLSNQLDLVCGQIKFTWLSVSVINFSLWIRDIQKHSIEHKRLYMMSRWWN